MTDNVHVLMRNADNIDAVFCNGIENHMPSFWKTIITGFNVIPPFAKPWIFCKPRKPTYIKRM